MGENIGNIDLWYKAEDGSREKYMTNKELPNNGKIVFDHPVLMWNFKIKIRSIAMGQSMVENFKMNFYGCTEIPSINIYNETKTTTPLVTYTRKYI